MADALSLPAREKKWLYFFIALAVFVNFSGLFVILMQPDAAVYAAVSKHMAVHNNYLELYLQGGDWLDKPHFPFWITAAFFKIFGIHTWSYKLPGILMVMVGAWYTYRFAKKQYNEAIGLWSVLIFLTAEHIMLSNNDVRAEPFLTGLIIAAIYHFSVAVQARWFWHLVAGACFTACAVMTKGIFIMAAVGGAVGLHLLLQRQWKALFHFKWLLAAVLILIFIMPELYSLWYQFDQHPEKEVFGQKGVSGVKFFFWDSQFGRFMNTGPIKGKGDKFFFVHTLLWAFLPWSILMYGGLIQKTRNAFNKQQRLQQEWYTLGGSVLTLLMFSLSGFQLPHYANIIFPLLGIITAWYLNGMGTKMPTFFKVIQYIIIAVALLLVTALQVFYQPVLPFFLWIVVVVGLVLLLFLLPRWLITSPLRMLLYRSAIAIMIVNLYLNWFFYPDLMRYQSTSEVAFYMNEHHPGKAVMNMDIYPNAMEFYLDGQYVKKDAAAVQKDAAAFVPGFWFVSADERAMLDRLGYRYTVVKEWENYPVTRLTLKFVNKKTREKEMRRQYLIEVR